MKSLLFCIAFAFGLASHAGIVQAQPHDSQRATSQVGMQVASPVQMYRLSADLFTRSYFADLKALPNWGPDHPSWSTQLASFSSDMNALLLPRGISLESHLASELARQMTPDELANIASAVAKDDWKKAESRLEELGASWSSLIEIQSVIREPKYYSTVEKERARTLVAALRGSVAADRGATLKAELAPIASLMSSPVFAKYQAAVGSAFMAGARRLDSPEGRKELGALMQRWHVRLGGRT